MDTVDTLNMFVREITAIPPSITEVATAVPAFIGYTGKAKDVKDNDLWMKPKKISSLYEYEKYFGRAHAEQFALTVTQNKTFAAGFAINVTPPRLTYKMFHCLKMFFANGGKQCYIVSVGPYTKEQAIELGNAKTRVGLLGGLARLAREDEPTLIVIPEAVELKLSDYATLTHKMLKQAKDLGDRFCIIDVYGGPDDTFNDATINAARDAFGTDGLMYGAAYYPFLKTTLNYTVNDAEDNVTVTYRTKSGEEKKGTLATFRAGGKNSEPAVYDFVRSELKKHTMTLPPSSAIAGIYAANDAERGVWNTPANINLENVIDPIVKIDNAKQEELYIDSTSGKSINAIRAFVGRGVLVWGARTLDGNSSEWRYVPVRRFMNTVEESVKKSTSWAVFEPNDATTWTKVRAMTENYLTHKWREGALMGAKPNEAFFVRCGLGTTMSQIDIDQGRLNVEIGMAVVRPAEFIILKFTHMLPPP